MKDLPRLKYDTPEGYNGNLAVVLHAIQSLHDRKEKLERELVLLQQSIEDAWRAAPALQVRRWLRCVKCDRPTQDRFGNRAMCSKHIHPDAGVASVLDEFLHGK